MEDPQLGPERDGAWAPPRPVGHAVRGSGPPPSSGQWPGKLLGDPLLNLVCNCVSEAAVTAKTKRPQRVSLVLILHFHFRAHVRDALHGEGGDGWSAVRRVGNREHSCLLSETGAYVLSAKNIWGTSPNSKFSCCLEGVFEHWKQGKGSVRRTVQRSDGNCLEQAFVLPCSFLQNK